MVNFKITFKRVIPDNKKSNILDNLIVNLSGSSYNSIKKIGNDKLIIFGDSSKICFRVVPWDLWKGFSKQVEVSIENNTIYYNLDYTLAAVSRIITILLLSVLLIIFFFLIKKNLSLLFYLFIFSVVYSILIVTYRIILHRNLFNYTLKYGSRFTGKYDWENILRKKSFKELKNIANGNTTLTEEVQELARNEIVRRRDKK